MVSVCSVSFNRLFLSGAPSGSRELLTIDKTPEEPLYILKVEN